MKFSAALAFLFLAPFSLCFCQDLTGNWSGKITQEGRQSSEDRELLIHVDMVQAGASLLSGQIRTSMGQDFVVQKFRGMIFNGKIIMGEYEVIKVSSKNFSWCLKNLEGLFSVNIAKNTRVIEGTWTSKRFYQASAYENGNCPPGTFSISQALPGRSRTGMQPTAYSVISGRVLDKQTGKPVKCILTVFGKEGGKQVVYTRNDGTYKFKVSVNDFSRVSIMADGYRLLKETISTDKPAFKKDFALVPGAVIKPENNEPVAATKTVRFSKPKLGEKITLDLRFEQSKPTVLPESMPELDRILNYLTEYPTFEIELSGHTDNVGDPVKNLRLSNERVNVVKQYLTDHGISSNRILGNGFGGKMPIAMNDNEDNRKRNRRVEMKVTKE